MNYISIYKSIIKKSKKQHKFRISNKKNKLEYYEFHHIIPKSIMLARKPWLNNKPNSRYNLINRPWNMILLTAREHFLVHKLLIKISSQLYGKKHAYTYKMIYAIMRFIYVKKGSRSKYSKITAREYDFLKKKVSKISSIVNKERLKDKTKHPCYGKTGSLHPCYGKRGWSKGKKRPEISGKKNGMYGKKSLYVKHSSATKMKMKMNQRRGEKSQNVAKRVMYKITKQNDSILIFNGMSKFCRDNLMYNQSCLSMLLHGIIKTHRDIIKIEKIKPHFQISAYLLHV